MPLDTGSGPVCTTRLLFKNLPVPQPQQPKYPYLPDKRHSQVFQESRQARFYMNLSVSRKCVIQYEREGPTTLRTFPPDASQQNGVEKLRYGVVSWTLTCLEVGWAMEMVLPEGTGNGRG
jgi:hypothetical protein